MQEQLQRVISVKRDEKPIMFDKPESSDQCLSDWTMTQKKHKNSTYLAK